MVGRSPLALTPELDEFRQAFDRLAEDATALVAPLDDEQYYWQPSPATWSIGQCLEHLNISARSYLPAIDLAIAAGAERGMYGAGPFRYLWTGRLLAWSLEPPPRFRTRASKALRPPPRRARRETMAAFGAYQVQYVDRLRQACGLDLGRVRVRSPVMPLLRISLGSAFAVAVAHERRHLWQAQTIAARWRRPAT